MLSALRYKIRFRATFVSVLVVIASLATRAEDVHLISLSTGTRTPVSQLLMAHSVEARGDAQFVKYTIVFEKPLVISKVNIDSCGHEFKDAVDFAFFPGWRSATAEGGKNTLQVQLSSTEPVRSMGVNFRRNESLCLKSMKIFDGSGNPISFKIAESQVASTSATEVEREKEKKLRNKFGEVGMIGLIDREWTSSEEGSRWIFRLRSDGTFFIRGFSDDYSEAHLFSAIGNFQYVSSREGAIRVHLVGRKAVTPRPWDGVICPQNCGESGTPQGVIIDEEIEFEKWQAHDIMARNRTVRAKRTLTFGDLRVRQTLFDE